jgi:hypothetical protein
MKNFMRNKETLGETENKYPSESGTSTPYRFSAGFIETVAGTPTPNHRPSPNIISKCGSASRVSSYPYQHLPVSEEQKVDDRD